MLTKTDIFLMMTTILTAVTAQAQNAPVSDRSQPTRQIQEMIWQQVHPDFQKTALHLTQNSRFTNIQNEKGLVIELNTKDLALEVSVNASDTKFTQEKRLPKVTRIPFPRTEDLQTCFGDQLCPTAEFRERLQKVGLGLEGRDTVEGANYHLDFLTISKRFSPFSEVKVHTRIILQENKNSFDSDGSAGFGNNTCNESVCVGGIYTDLRLISK